MDRKQHIREELTRLLATAGPPPPPIDLEHARRRTARKRFVTAMEHRVVDLGLKENFARYLSCTFGVDDACGLSDGDLVRAALWVDRCATILEAADL